MKEVKGLPNQCRKCQTGIERKLRSCRQYKCSCFPQRERVCAAEELSAALSRFNIRLESSDRARNENELLHQQISEELFEKGRRKAFDILHSPERLQDVRSRLEEWADEKAAEKLLLLLLDTSSYEEFHAACLVFKAFTGLDIEEQDSESEDEHVDDDGDCGDDDDKETDISE